MWGWRLPIYLVRFKVSMWWTLERGLVNMTNSSSLLPLLTRLLMHAHSDFSQPLYTYVPRYTHLRRLSCMHAHTYIGRWIPPSSCRQPLAAHVTSNNDVYALHDTSARTHTHTHAHTHAHTHTGTPALQRTRTCMNNCMHAYTTCHIPTRTCLHKHIYVNTYVHMYRVCICM